MNHFSDFLASQADKPTAGVTLLAAGAVPIWFNSDFLSVIYFLFLIPPAAYHCYRWFRNAVWPSIKKLFTKK